MKNFNQLSKTEKRVLIAKDALQQLFLEHYKAKNGTYVSQKVTKQDRKKLNQLRADYRYHDYDEYKVTALENGLTQGEPCQVCAIGSCMASAIRFGITPSESYVTDNNANLHYEDFQWKLNKIFDDKTLRLMEAHFENEFVDEMEPFYSEWLGGYKADVRLYGILKNVIKNKGKFIPPAKFDSKLKDRFEKEKTDYLRKVKLRAAKDKR